MYMCMYTYQEHSHVVYPPTRRCLRRSHPRVCRCYYYYYYFYYVYFYYYYYYYCCCYCYYYY